LLLFFLMVFFFKLVFSFIYLFILWVFICLFLLGVCSNISRGLFGQVISNIKNGMSEAVVVSDPGKEAVDKAIVKF